MNVVRIFDLFVKYNDKVRELNDCLTFGRIPEDIIADQDIWRRSAHSLLNIYRKEQGNDVGGSLSCNSVRNNLRSAIPQCKVQSEEARAHHKK